MPMYSKREVKKVFRLQSFCDLEPVRFQDNFVSRADLLLPEPLMFGIYTKEFD